MDQNDLKRYYSIGEVAKHFGVSKSLIRFWETEFDVLKPAKNSKGDRRFTKKNMDQLREIYHLVKERGFTLNGAKKEIERLRQFREEKQDILRSLRGVRDLLEELKYRI